MVLILLEANPKDKSWAAAAKMMNNVDKFLERLRSFKAVIDEGKVRGRAQIIICLFPFSPDHALSLQLRLCSSHACARPAEQQRAKALLNTD